MHSYFFIVQPLDGSYIALLFSCRSRYFEHTLNG